MSAATLAVFSHINARAFHNLIVTDCQSHQVQPVGKLDDVQKYDGHVDTVLDVATSSDGHFLVGKQFSVVI